MNKSHTIEISNIGTVLFERSKRAKHMIIYVRPHTGVQVAVPSKQSFEKAEEFVHTKISWIQKHLERFDKYRGVNESVSNNYTSFNRAQAKTKITKRLEVLAAMHGFTYNRVFFRNQRTRWGSCSHQNNISLNLKLAGLPAELLDYVILHELVHTRHKNHGHDFWAELDNFVPNSKKKSAQLRLYAI